MKLAIIGSRGLGIDIDSYVDDNVDEIVSGGAVGIDNCAKQYAEQNKLKLVEFLPDYDKFGRGAPLIRNRQIVDYSDKVLAIWDGKSRGTKYTIDYAKKKNKDVTIVMK